MEDQNTLVASESNGETLPVLRLGSLPASAPDDVIKIGTDVAKGIAAIIEDRQLFVNIQGKNHVLVEGWTTMAAMLGVSPVEESCVPYPTENPTGWEATVKLIRVSDGQIIGRGSAICTRGERSWANRDEYAIKSMAITRACGKSCRLAFSWIIQLAGYSPTPAEEMMGLSNGSNGNGNGAAQSTPPELVPFTGGNDKPDAPPSQKPRTTRKKVVSKPVSKPATTTLEVDGKVLKLDERSYMDRRSGESKAMFFVRLETDSGEEDYCLFSESVAADLRSWVDSNVHLSLDPPRSSNQKPTVRAASQIGVEPDQIPATLSLSDDDIPF